MAAPGRGQVSAFYDGQPRKADGRFDYGKMASVSTASLPEGWRGLKLGGKVQYALTQHEGVDFKNKAVGEIIVTSAGMRHSMKMYSGPMKEALLCDSKALGEVLRNGKVELLPNTKPHVGATFGIAAKVKIDGKVRGVQFIVHRLKGPGPQACQLHHVRLHK